MSMNLEEVENSVPMSNMTEHERMLQSILTNEVDPQKNNLALISESTTVVLETTAHYSTGDLMHNRDDVVAETNELDNSHSESKRWFRVLCLWC